MKQNYNSYFMKAAFDEAFKAYKKNEVPVGSVVVLNNKIIGRGHNRVIENFSVSAHAEILAMNDACKTISNYRLVEAEIYTTLEPCHMCAKAIIDARISKLYFAASEPKTGAITSIDNFFERIDLNHRVHSSGGYMAKKSSSLLRAFFLSRRG